MHERISLLMGRVAASTLNAIKRDDGQTTVEYAVILALVIALAVGAFAVLDPAVTDFMSKVGTSITNQLP